MTERTVKDISWKSKLAGFIFAASQSEKFTRLLIKNICGWPYVRAINYHALPYEHMDNFTRQMAYLSEHFESVDLRMLEDFVSKGTWKSKRPGLTTGYDADYRRYELGTVSLMRVFKDLCGTNIRMVDFGRGDVGYKQRFGTSYLEVASTRVFSVTDRGVLLYCLFRTIGLGSRLVRRLPSLADMLEGISKWRVRLQSMQSWVVRG